MSQAACETAAILHKSDRTRLVELSVRDKGFTLLRLVERIRLVREGRGRSGGGSVRERSLTEKWFTVPISSRGDLVTRSRKNGEK